MHFDNSDSKINLENEEDEFARIKNNTPQSAQDILIFQNTELFLIIDDKGCISDEYWNLKYKGLYQDWYYMSYLSINDGEVQPFSNFTVIQSLTNLTDFKNGGFTSQLVAEIIIQHPSENVFVKIQIKMYPDEEFFVMTFMIWSDTFEINKAELFIYDDLDTDQTASNDIAYYDSSTELIYVSDIDSQNTLGWVSTYPIYSWDLGSPINVEENVLDDDLGKTISFPFPVMDGADVSIATKYEKKNFEENETWVVPLIYGFATSESSLDTKTVHVKDDFINDFSVLDFTPNFIKDPYVDATILNGGQNKMTRNISIFLNGKHIESQDIDLLPGEIGNVNFNNLNLITDESYEITVTVNDTVNDYEPNNEISHTYLYQKLFRINVNDLEGYDVEGLNVSLYQQGTPILIDSTITDEYGNASFYSVPSDDYTIQAFAPWVENRQVHEENFTYPDVGYSYQIHTNLTTLVLHIEDFEGYLVENATIDIFEDINPGVIIWSGVTDQYGNLTFQYLNQTYDINVSYYDYEILTILEPISDLILTEKTYYTHQISLINLTFHIKASVSQDDLVGAKLEFYERMKE
ncbi:MAG: hypothetical protein ACTSPA_00395 [Promethearchaeota archaeon]